VRRTRRTDLGCDFVAWVPGQGLAISGTGTGTLIGEDTPPSLRSLPKEKPCRSTSKASPGLLAFRDAREWAKFHNAKDLALGLSIEASELVEAFLWKAPEEVDRKRVEEELADVLIYVLLLTEKYGFDLGKIVLEKIAKNEQRYPVEKSRGTSRKYDEL